MSLPRYEEYKDSGIAWLGLVPINWAVNRLKTKVRLVTKKASQRTNSVALENIESWSGRFIRSDAEFEGEGVAFKDGDILFGKLRPYLAKVYLADCAGEAVGDFHVLRPAKTMIGRFVQYQILSHAFIDVVDGSTFGSKMPRASWECLGNMPLATPPSKEQTVIAAFLDRETAKIDALITEQEKLIGLLAEKRQATISHTVTRGLNPNAPMKDSGVAWLGEVPAHWEIKELKHLGEAITGLTYDPSDVVEEDYGTLVLRSSNVQQGQITLDDNVFVSTSIPDKLRTIEGDILICSRNGSRNLIGKNALLTKEVESVTFGAFMTVFRSGLNAFLYWVFNSQVFSYQSGTFLTSTINQLTISNLYSIEVPLPPQFEQIEISLHLNAKTTQLDTLTTQAMRTIDLLKERRSALISAAVTGQIDVRGLAEHPTS